MSLNFVGQFHVTLQSFPITSYVCAPVCVCVGGLPQSQNLVMVFSPLRNYSLLVKSIILLCWIYLCTSIFKKKVLFPQELIRYIYPNSWQLAYIKILALNLSPSSIVSYKHSVFWSIVKSINNFSELGPWTNKESGLWCLGMKTINYKRVSNFKN